MTTVSFSEVSTWQTCTRQYYYQYTLGLTPLELSPAFQSGINGHLMLEIAFKAIKNGGDISAALDAVRALAPIEITKEFMIPYVLVENYLKELDFSDIEFIYIEDAFVAPVAEVFNLNIGFTPDVVFLRKGKRLDIEDAKFVGRAWSRNKLDRYSQLNLYNVFLTELGHNVNRSVLRFFNTTTGKLTYHLYDPSPEERKIIRKEFLLAALQIQEFKERPVAEQVDLAIRTFNNNTCQYCHFVYPCQLEAKGKDASRTLATQYKENIYGYER